MKQLASYFVSGCLVVAPVGITLYLLVWALTTVDKLLDLGVPGLGFAFALGFITLVGFLTSNVLGRSVVELAESVFRRVPVVKLLYTSIKDLLGAVMGQRATFNQPVSVVLDRASDIRLMGFITRDSLERLGLPGHVAVYLPQSYNVAGNVLAVPTERVEPLEASTSELFTFLMSGGVSGFGVGESLRPPPPPPS